MRHHMVEVKAKHCLLRAIDLHIIYRITLSA
jgi:hypothetical protein